MPTTNSEGKDFFIRLPSTGASSTFSAFPSAADRLSDARSVASVYTLQSNAASPSVQPPASRPVSAPLQFHMALYGNQDDTEPLRTPHPRESVYRGLRLGDSMSEQESQLLDGAWSPNTTSDFFLNNVQQLSNTCAPNQLAQRIKQSTTAGAAAATAVRRFSRGDAAPVLTSSPMDRPPPQQQRERSALTSKSSPHMVNSPHAQNRTMIEKGTTQQRGREDSTLRFFSASLISEAVRLHTDTRLWHNLPSPVEECTVDVANLRPSDWCVCEEPHLRSVRDKRGAPSGTAAVPLYRCSTTIDCSLETFSAFLFETKNVYNYEADVKTNQVVKTFGRGQGALVHRTYKRVPALDVVTINYVHVGHVDYPYIEQDRSSQGLPATADPSVMLYRASQQFARCLPTQEGTRHAGLLLYTSTSVDDPRVPLPYDCLRCQNLFSAFLTYEIAPRSRALGSSVAAAQTRIVHLYSHENGPLELTPTLLAYRVLQIKSLCEMLQRMVASSRMTVQCTAARFTESVTRSDAGRGAGYAPSSASTGSTAGVCVRSADNESFLEYYNGRCANMRSFIPGQHEHSSTTAGAGAAASPEPRRPRLSASTSECSASVGAAPSSRAFPRVTGIVDKPVLSIDDESTTACRPTQNNFSIPLKLLRQKESTTVTSVGVQTGRDHDLERFSEIPAVEEGEDRSLFERFPFHSHLNYHSPNTIPSSSTAASAAAVAERAKHLTAPKPSSTLKKPEKNDVIDNAVGAGNKADAVPMDVPHFARRGVEKRTASSSSGGGGGSGGSVPKMRASRPASAHLPPPSPPLPRGSSARRTPAAVAPTTGVHITKRPSIAQETRAASTHSPELKVVLHSCTHLPLKPFGHDHALSYKDIRLIIYLRSGTTTRYKSKPFPYFPSVHLREETFVFPVENNGKGKTLTLTCAVETPTKLTKIGVAVLYMGNQARNSRHSYCLPIVGKAGTADARERGMLQLTLVPQGYGEKPRSLLSYTQESAVRRSLRSILTSSDEGKKDFHKLEWFVGMCRGLTMRQVQRRLAQLQEHMDRKAALHAPAPRYASAVPQIALEGTAAPTTAATAAAAQTEGVLTTENAEKHRRTTPRPLQPELLQKRRRRPHTAQPAQQVRTKRTNEKKGKKSTGEQRCTLSVRVKEVLHLSTPQGDLLEDCVACGVSMEIMTKERKLLPQNNTAVEKEVQPNHFRSTRAVPYENHYAMFTQGPISLQVENPNADYLRLKVYSGNERCHDVVGICDISLRYLHHDQATHLSCVVVGDAGTPQAAPCGTLKVDLAPVGSAYGLQQTSTSLEVKEALARKESSRSRVATYLWSNWRATLHQLDLLLDDVVKEGSTQPFILKHAKQHGRETPFSGISFHVHEWITGKQEVSSSGNMAADVVKAHDTILENKYGGGTDANAALLQGPLYVVISVGPHRFVSLPVLPPPTTSPATLPQATNATKPEPVCIPIDVKTKFEGVLPEKDECRIKLFAQVEDGADIELAAAELPLCMLTAAVTLQRVQLPLVHMATGVGATFYGTLELDVRGVGNAYTRTETWAGWESSHPLRQRLAQLMYYNASESLHRMLCVLAEDEKHTDAARSLYGPLRDVVPATLRITGLRNMDASLGQTACYVKVYYKNKPLLRTPDVPLDTPALVRLQGVKNTAESFSLTDPDHSTLRVKLGKAHKLSSNTALAYAEFHAGILQAEGSAGSVEEHWVPLFHNSTHTFLGEVGVVLSSLQIGLKELAKRRGGKGGQPREWPNQQRVPADEVERLVARDVCSLLMAHDKLLLPRAQVLSFPFLDRATAHANLRRLAILPAQSHATLYVNLCGLVSSIPNLFVFENKKEYEFLQVTLVYSGSSGSAECPLLVSASTVGAKSRSTDPVDPHCIRLEIPTPMAYIDVAEDPGLEIIVQHVVRKDTRGRTHSSAQSRSGSQTQANTSRPRSRSQSASGTLDTRATTTTARSARATSAAEAKEDGGATTYTVVPTELGRARVSLRSFLSPPVYRQGEMIDIPIVASSRTVSSRLSIQQQQVLHRALPSLVEKDDVYVMGSLFFSLDTPYGEAMPAWMQLPPDTRDVDVEKRNTFASHVEAYSTREPSVLLDAHYNLFEGMSNCMAEQSACASSAPEGPIHDNNNNNNNNNNNSAQKKKEGEISPSTDFGGLTVLLSNSNSINGEERTAPKN